MIQPYRLTALITPPVALAAALSFAASAAVAQTPPAAAPSRVVRSIKAADFMNTFGANVHFGDNNYRNVQAIADALNILGFGRVRSPCLTQADGAAWRELAAKSAGYFPSGLKADVLVIGYQNARENSFTRQQPLIAHIADMVESVEGPNEINNRAVGDGTHGPFDTTDQTTNWASNYAAWAKAIDAWKRATPALAHARVFAPSIASGDPADYARLPHVSPYVTDGNLHFYAGNGRQPSNFGGGNFAAIDDWYRAAATPEKPVAVTEWGQTTASKPGQGGCDNATQAKYVLNQMFDLVARGVDRAYVYQLMDDTPDGDPSSNGGAEAHFGLFDYRWGVKPAAQAIANLKNLLQDKTASFTPHLPDYRIDGLTSPGAAGSSLAISKSDGTTFLVVWNEPPIWDPKANAPLTPPADRVTVIFGGAYTYKVYDPLKGLQAIDAGEGAQVAINLVGSPLLIELRGRR